MVQIKLSNVIDGIASKLGTTARYSEANDEYVLNNVSKDKLLEVGFEFISYDSSEKYPIYRYENIEAIFDRGVLYLYQI